ncbi:MAG: 4Fe-4S dicluster domain-containing protein [Candidatus Bathyarchaeota archaeon]|nr:MAG: 4Fe-4S dicluster domain-containing protein [Candidatus Bathyarchaeota archaeon]
MTRKVIACDQEKCTGCGICELVCSATKEKNFNPLRSRIRITKIEPLIDVALACRFCEDAPCVAACPREVLIQNEATSIVLAEEDKCTGCGWCIEACEFGAITFNAHRKTMIVCDLCDGLPVCVEFCPRDALELSTPRVLSDKARRSAVEKLF